MSLFAGYIISLAGVKHKMMMINHVLFQSLEFSGGLYPVYMVTSRISPGHLCGFCKLDRSILVLFPTNTAIDLD